MTSQCLLIILLILFLIFITHDNSNSSSSSNQQRATVHNAKNGQNMAKEKAVLDSPESLSYGSFDPESDKWLNVTGFQSHGSIPWTTVLKVKDKARELVRRVHGQDWDKVDDDGMKLPFYRNVTGIVVGGWRSVTKVVDDGTETGSMTEMGNLTTWKGALLDRRYDRNVTAHDGRVKLQFTQEEEPIESVNDSVAEITAQMTVLDDLSLGHEWKFSLQGVSFLDTGVIILSTTSEKFDGILGLLSLTLSRGQFNLSKELLTRLYERPDTESEPEPEADSSPLSIESDEPDIQHSIPQCELVVYLQQQPVYMQKLRYDLPDSKLRAFLTKLEHHLRFPSGYRYFAVPDIVMSMIAYSPDCGYIIQSDGQSSYALSSGSYLQGPKFEVLLMRIRRDISMFAAVLVFEIWLTIRQMKEASTPSMRSRVSIYTITILSLGDGFALLTLIYMSLSFDAASELLRATAFFGTLAYEFYSMRFLADICSDQTPERQRRERQQHARAAGAIAPTRVLTTTAGTPTAEGLPLPVTAGRPAVSDGGTGTTSTNQDVNAEAVSVQDSVPSTAATTNTTTTNPGFGTIDFRINLTLVIIASLSVYAAFWSPLLRTAYIHLLSLVHLSFWVPQIYRNIHRNCRKALRWEYVFGRSALRLFPYAYFYTYSNNVLFVKLAPTAFLYLSTWVWLQVLVLLSMSLVGPRFLAPQGWAPPAYDYHPMLREGDEGGGGGGSFLPPGFLVLENDDEPCLADDGKQSNKTTVRILNTTSKVLPPDSSSNLVASSSDQPRSESSGASKTAVAATGSSKQSKSKKQLVYDCAICMQRISVPVSGNTSQTFHHPSASRSGSGSTRSALAIAMTATMGSATSGGAAGILTRRQYMVTPCRHIFHTACLEGWMRYRLECPICRDVLPPL